VRFEGGEEHQQTDAFKAVNIPAGESLVAVKYLDYYDTEKVNLQNCSNSSQSGNLKGLPQCVNAGIKYKQIFGADAFQRCKVDNGKPCKPYNHGVGDSPYDHEYGCYECTIDALWGAKDTTAKIVINDEEELKPFTCSQDAYLFNSKNPSKIHTINLTDGSTKQVGMIDSRFINGAGYNIKDDLIWGYDINNNEVIKVDADFNVVGYKIDNLPKGKYYAGDVSQDGILYLKKHNDSKLYKIDLNSAKPKYSEPVTLKEGESVSTANFGDFAFNPKDNMLYGISEKQDNTYNHLYKVNPANGQVTDLGEANPGVEVHYHTFVFDVDGNLYFYGSTGKIYKIKIAQEEYKAELFAETDNKSGGGDGARCPNAKVEEPVKPEGKPFTCSINSYLFGSDQDDPFANAYNMSLTDGKIERVKKIEGSHINATGYNVEDNYIYGFEYGDYESDSDEDRYFVVRIDADFHKKRYKIDGLPNEVYYLGDVSFDGIYYLANRQEDTTSSSRGGHGRGSTNSRNGHQNRHRWRGGRDSRDSSDVLLEIQRIDVSKMKLLSKLVLQYPRNVKKIISADFAFNPKDKKIYTINAVNNSLYRIDPDTGNVENLGSVGLQNTYSVISFFDKDGYFYFYKNDDKKVYRIDVSNPSSVNPVAHPFSDISSQMITSGDGARCPNASVPPPPPSDGFCTSGIIEEVSIPNSDFDNGVNNWSHINFEKGSTYSAHNAFYVYGWDQGTLSQDITIEPNVEYQLKFMGAYSVKKNRVSDTSDSTYKNQKVIVKFDSGSEKSQNVDHWVFDDNGLAEYTMNLGKAPESANKLNLKAYAGDGDSFIKIDYFRLYKCKKDGNDSSPNVKFNIWDQDESISHQVIKTKIVGEDINLTFASLDENGTQFKTTDIDNIKVAFFSEGNQITMWRSLVLENSTHMNISFQPSIFRWFDLPMQRNQNYQNKAFKDVVVKMQYTDENNVVHTVSSTDHFAIRPYAYKITPDSSNLVAGEDFNLTLQAVDRNNNIITNYAEDTTVYTIEANETKSGQGCNHGGSINIQKHNFTQGETKSEVSYADIGELTFKIHEIDTKEFASIDRDDTSAAQRFIRGATIVSSEIKPADISIEWELENGDNVNQYTYFNDYNHTDPDRQMSAKFNVSVSLLNKTRDNVKNFTAECDYAKDISLRINYLSQSIESGGYEIVGEYKDQNDTYATSLSTLPSNIDIGDNSFSGYKLEKTLFKFGLGIKKAEFSLKRDVDVPREPLLFTIKDVTAMVPSSTLTKTKYNPTTVKFLYARAHIPDQKIVGNKGDAHVFYEVYCKDSNRTQFGLDGLEESKDSIYWYILKNINETYSDFSVPPSLNGFGTYAGITANYNGFLSAVSHTSNNILHIESAKSPSVVRIKYKPKKYLVFNRFNATANNHSFTAIFTPKEKSWGGKGSVGHTVDMVVSPRNNMNIIDW